jgi:hypothetical protein
VFSATQKTVVLSALIGVAVCLLMVFAGSSSTLHFESTDRLVLLSRALVAPAVFLIVCIGRMANHRFFTPEDIDGDPRRADTPKAIELQRVLQNTVEQSVLATIVYAMWTMVAPVQSVGTVLIAAGLFAVGRVLFMAFHGKGASGRAIGFVLTFYPTCTLFIETLLILLR